MTAPNLFGKKVTAGQKTKFRAPIAELPDGTPVTVPVVVVRGVEDGPTLALSGAIHGDEYNGVAAISRLFQQLEPRDLHGTLIGVPVMNPFAYYAERRLNIFDYELQNLNRIFPGDPRGDLGQIMAHRLFTEIFGSTDYVIDYHEGGRDFMARYLIVGGGLEEDGQTFERGREMARWFGHGVPTVPTRRLHVERRPGYSGTLSGATGRQGISTIAAELGGAGRVWEEHVADAIGGTRNVMIGLGMLSGEMLRTQEQQYFCETHEWPRPTRSGLLVPTPVAELNAVVDEGELLANIVDPFGEVVEEIRAPFRSVILDTRHSAVVYPGDWTYHCGKID
ncbi:MAG: succinylglutamate desuccinylase/aspartoacylase family protein [Ardenticatenaceae bacterium]|nr:succinylglutamate desuccinylase/aspartoacylase family protein [Ardenticatenaceae bacterium]HBY93955.1 hypothetical protein [Chloroflexota bacterium]